MEIVNEKQYYEPDFTEFDLDISGFTMSYISTKYSILYGQYTAENTTYLDGNYSTMYMDRSYNQYQYKFKYDYDSNIGIILNIYKKEISTYGK